MKNPFLLLSLLAFFAFACGDSTETTSTDAEAEANKEAEVDTPSPSYAISPFPGATDYPDATISSFTYEDNAFSFEIPEGTYQLGAQTPDADARMCANSGKGQHIHLILNNEPYAAKYEADFDYPLEDGNYHMLAFLSRSYHQSIKTAAAHKAGIISVQDGTINGMKEIKDPMVVYSRPKGTYVGKANTEKVLLDFYMLNAELGADFKVKVNINGTDAGMLDNWQAYSIEGLPMGENTVTLTLVDGAGNTVEAPHNPVSRKFTLQADPIEQ